MKIRFDLRGGFLLTLVLVLLTSSIVTEVQATPGAAAPLPGFAYRCGIHFCIDGQPFYFGGANTYDVFTFGDGSSSGTQADIETRFMDKARIDAHFARLQADKVTVLRLWMFSHETWHGFETQEGIYNEAQFMLFDYIIESAKAHDVMLMPVFENYWEAYGGIDTRLAWEGLTGGHPGRWKFFNKSICPGCFDSYKNYVSYALNRTNHYSGIKYKDEPTIFAWELMNEPRYQDATPNENSTGTTLRLWVDEMGQYIKSIDSNHMLSTGLEAHESRYGFGGDEGNPFIYIHQSPYIDFTSAHPYPTETWANLSIAQTRALVRAWISDSHDVVGKPFYLGEFNTHTGVRTDWWSAIFDEMEINDGDGTGFWWYQDHAVDSKFGVSQGASELAAFRQHSDDMRAKSGPRPTRTPSPTPDPTRILKVQYMTLNTAATTNQITAYTRIVNTGVGLQSVPMSELKLRYWYTTDTAIADQYGCLYAGSGTPGCANLTATVVTLNPPRANADRYLELSFNAAAGSILPYGSSSDIQNRINKSDWSSYTQTNDYSFDATKTAFADWNRVTLYRNGVLVWGVEPLPGGSVTPTFTYTPTATGSPGTLTITPSRTNTPTATLTNTPTFTVTPTQPMGNNTGWVSPSGQASQSGGDGNGFQTSPTNAFADGGGIATDTNSGTGTSTSCTSTAKDRHAYFNYPLAIPSGSSITGIEVRTDARADSTSGAPHFCVEVSWNNGTTWTAMKTGPNLLTTERSDILGSASDTWGRTWNTSELTSANFRVRVVSVSSSTSRDFFLDWLPVRVWYSNGGPTDTPTATSTPTRTPTATVTSYPTFIIEGYVRLDSSSGSGVPGVPIAVWFGGPHGQVTTDADGYYRAVLPIPPNQETVSITPQLAGYIFSPESYNWIVYSYNTGPYPRDFVATAGATLTPTATPTTTATTGPTTLRVQYRAADTNAGDNQIKPHFNIVNAGTSAVPLSELKIRYWFTREGTQNQSFWCDWAMITGSCSNVSGTFVQINPARSGADFYLEVTFAAAAGSITAGGQSGEIQTRISKSDWSNYTETGDYSFDPTRTAFADWNRVTLYRNGVLVWGVEP